VVVRSLWWRPLDCLTVKFTAALFKEASNNWYTNGVSTSNHIDKATYVELIHNYNIKINSSYFGHYFCGHLQGEKLLTVNIS